VNKNAGQDFLKGQAFNATYHLKQQTQQSAPINFFAKMMKFFETDKVEVRKLSHLPIVLLDNRFCIDNESKRNVEQQITNIADSFE